jgi:prepilin-type N-terminal cleavage/methylation domain-containing protein
MSVMTSGRRGGDQGGFSLIELLIVVAVIGILASIAVVVYNNMQARARIAQAEADARTIASSVSMYSAHMGGALPSALSVLTASSSNAQGQTAGAFLAGIPIPPTGWASAYTYASGADNSFTVSATGDGTTAKQP